MDLGARERPMRGHDRHRLPARREGPVSDVDLVAEVDQRHSEGRGVAGDLARGLILALADDPVHAGVQDAGLLARDVGERRAEDLGMLPLDGRDHSDRGVDHVRRVEPATQSDLDHRVPHPLAAEPIERHRGGHLEEGRSPRDRPGTLEPVRGRLHLPHSRRDGPGVDRHPVDLHPLAVADEMGRGEQTRPASAGGQDRRRHRRDGPLALRPRHVDRAEVALRLAELGQQRPDHLEPRGHAEPAPLVQPL
jgi:hypothetical protein